LVTNIPVLKPVVDATVTTFDPDVSDPPSITPYTSVCPVAVPVALFDTRIWFTLSIAVTFVPAGKFALVTVIPTAKPNVEFNPVTTFDPIPTLPPVMLGLLAACAL
jgi:hypothetical protein